MGMIINIDKALELRTDYNVLKEPLNKMMQDMQEAWERENPIDMLFARNTIKSFQETYTSSIGFDRAFTETSDHNIGPIFNTAEGFAATYRTRTFQGGFVITQQAMEDRQYGKIKDDANAYVKRWHADIVDYCMKSLDGGFAAPHSIANPVDWVGGDLKVTKLKLESADTTDGDINTATKTSLFNKEHYVVKREGMTRVLAQSNAFVSNGEIKLDGSDALYIAKLADLINQVCTYMENVRDDNGKRAGVLGEKLIVAPNDPHLKAALDNALSMKEVCGIPNPGYGRATYKVSPYLMDVASVYDETNRKATGFFIVDRGYNAANHGLELTERIPFTLDVTESKRPFQINYDGRQRFDVNVATWRGIAYVRFGATVASASATTQKPYEITENLTALTPVAVGKAVSIVAPLDDGSLAVKEQT